MKNIYKDKVILITGGTGSFGNMMLKRMLKTDIKQVRIFSRDEVKQQTMRNHYKDSRIKYYIGDVRDEASVGRIMKNVNFIFHAAALKQVPTAEQFPLQYIKTNILGSTNVINKAIENQVDKIILLSTDKSVYPINTMGITKALMQKLAILSIGTKTTISITRYGNILNSRGSILPLFKEQLSQHNKLFVTNPDMTRYLMSLDEAIQLVLYALEFGDQGQIMVQKSPAATIGDLALAFKQLYGNKDTGIEVIGNRAGQKLHETLINYQETFRSKDCKLYFSIHPTKNYGQLKEEYNSFNTKRLTVVEIKEMMLNNL